MDLIRAGGGPQRWQLVPGWPRSGYSLLRPTRCYNQKSDYGLILCVSVPVETCTFQVYLEISLGVPLTQRGQPGGPQHNWGSPPWAGFSLSKGEEGSISDKQDDYVLSLISQHLLPLSCNALFLFLAGSGFQEAFFTFLPCHSQGASHIHAD